MIFKDKAVIRGCFSLCHRNLIDISQPGGIIYGVPHSSLQIPQFTSTCTMFKGSLGSNSRTSMAAPYLPLWLKSNHMGDIQNLSGAKALEKIRELSEEKTTMFCTFEGEQMITRPMHTQGIDDDGTFWFFSEKDSPKNQMIEENPTVHLIYANESNCEYLSIEGTASIEHDQEKINELWKEFAKAWFTEGKTDPSLTLVRVIPESGHYWDTKSNKVISLMKIAVSALTGKTIDNGLEGDLKV